MTQQGQGDVVGRSSEWTFTDCLKVAQAGYGEWALNPRNDVATEHLAGTVIVSDMMACIAEAFRRALADASLSSSIGEQGWRTIDSAPNSDEFILTFDARDPNPIRIRKADAEWWRVEKCGPTHWMPLPSAPGSVPTSVGHDLVDGKFGADTDDDTTDWGQENVERRTRTENENIAIAYAAIEAIWGGSMTWQQIDTLSRQIVRALGSVPTSVAGQVPDVISEITAILDKHQIAMPGGSCSWTLQDRVLIACRAANSDELPYGYVLVPKEPTRKMKNDFTLASDKALTVFSDDPLDWFKAGWAAALSAAPQPTAGGDAEGRIVAAMTANLCGEATLANALSAERARVIAETEAAIKAVIDPIADETDSAFRNGAIAALAALRALGQQDTGGAG
jgi:hypothetical protein